MVNLENIGRIAEVIGVAIGSSWLTHILTVRSRVRKEKADAAKAETEVEADKIANLRKVIDDAYRPIIQDLKNEIADLKQKVEDQQVEMTEIKSKNEMLEAENKELREAVKRIRPDAAPNIRSIQAKHQPRNGGGQFTKAGGKGNQS